MFNRTPLIILAEAAFAAAAAAISIPSTTSSSPNWVTLNQTLNGRLQSAVPLAQPCFSEGEGGSLLVTNVTACEVVESNYDGHVYRTETFGAYEFLQWEECQTTGEQCTLDVNNPFNTAAFAAPAQCAIGNIPPFYIDVQSASDVQIAINFTRNTSVPLVVKNTGHDYKGRSAGIGSLALWTHNLDTLDFEPQFVPDQCSSEPVTAITLGAGQIFTNIYAFATSHNVTFVGGADPSVGASGGWVMGGGHSALSPSLGLGVDRVLQFKIVTGDGVFRTANACENEDLFWALRGGGGGTFGVVLESTHLVTPQVEIQAMWGRWENSVENSTQVVKALAGIAVDMASAGWGGYITPAEGQAIWANPKLSASDVQNSAATQTVIDTMAAVGGNTTFFTLPSFGDFYNEFIGTEPDPVAISQVMATRIIPDSKMGDEALIDTLTSSILTSQFGQILAVPPYAFKDYEANGTSINPAWRTGIWHALMSYNWNYDATIDDRLEAYRNLTTQWAMVRELTPGAAVYQNEADVYEPNHEEAFWGDNYPALLAIKNKYDPDQIFDCWHCVGWKGAQDPRYQCYLNTTITTA